MAQKLGTYGFGKTQPHPTPEAKSLGQLKKNWKERIIKKVFEKKIKTFSPSEIEKLKTLLPFVDDEMDIEQVVVENLSRYVALNQNIALSLNVIHVIKHLCTSHLDDYAEQLVLNITNDQANY